MLELPGSELPDKHTIHMRVYISNSYNPLSKILFGKVSFLVARLKRKKRDDYKGFLFSVSPTQQVISSPLSAFKLISKLNSDC